MIDTIKFRLIDGCSWIAPKSEFSEWDFRESSVVLKKTVREGGQVGSADEGMMMTHTVSGLRVWGSYFVPEFVEVSLPKFYFGRNGVLLKTDQEITAALYLLERKVREVCEIPEFVSVPGADQDENGTFTRLLPVLPLDLFSRIQRIDLVWQFEGQIADWIQAYRNCKLNAVRRPVEEYKDSGLKWPGQDLQVRIYDKRKEQHNKSGNVVRVESQIRGKKLDEFEIRDPKDLLGGFSWLWWMFKGVVLALNPKDRYEPGNLADLIALLEAQGIRVGNQSVFELYCTGKHRSTVSRMRNKVAEAMPKRTGINLWDLCAVPVPVDLPVEPEKEKLPRSKAMRKEA